MKVEGFASGPEKHVEQPRAHAVSARVDSVTAPRILPVSRLLTPDAMDHRLGITKGPAGLGQSKVLDLLGPKRNVPVRAIPIAGKVAWTRHTTGEEGLGVEFKTRDTGGTRRLKELVRRLELLEAENMHDDASDRDGISSSLN